MRFVQFFATRPQPDRAYQPWFTEHTKVLVKFQNRTQNGSIKIQGIFTSTYFEMELWLDPLFSLRALTASTISCSILPIHKQLLQFQHKQIPVYLVHKTAPEISLQCLSFR
jgi:hypothetical protein